MPNGPPIVRSGAHRIACQSLYRKLLTACRNIPSAPAPSSDLPSNLQSLVRYRYHYDRTLQSHSQIRGALSFGRKALHLLDDASSGSPDGLKKITHVLSAFAEASTSLAKVRDHVSKDLDRYPVKAIKKREFIRHVTDPANHVRKPSSIPILERPVPLSQIKGGRRYVPRFVFTQGMSFLQYGKPQPYSLSLYIRGEIRKDDKRWEHKRAMEHMTAMGRYEDEWDRILCDAHAIPDDDQRLGREGSWSTVFKDEEDETMRRIRTKVKKLQDYGKTLWEISLKEEELAAEEKKAAKLERRRMKNEKKKEYVLRQDDPSFLGE